MTKYGRNTDNTVYYYDKSGIESGIVNCCIGQEDHILTEEELENDSYRKELYGNSLIFVGVSPLPPGYPLEDPDNPGYVRLATRYELIQMGLDELKEGEKIVDKEVITVEKPNNFAKWNSETFVWETDFDNLPAGWKIIDRETQELKYVSSPNYAAEWNKETEEWVTNIDKLNDGDRLLEDGSIEHIEKPEDDNQHIWTWDKTTFSYINSITDEQITENWHAFVSAMKQEVIDEGFMFRGYQQKCRVLDMNWITQRMNQTKDDALLKGQINILYELQGETTRDDLMKVGWVFAFNEVLMMDIIDFKELFDMGASFAQAVYIVEEVVKGMEPNFDLTKEEFRQIMSRFSDVTPYNYRSADSEIATLDLNEEKESRESEEAVSGHDMNPGHKLGLTGAEVMIAAHRGITLEEAAAEKYNTTVEKQ